MHKMYTHAESACRQQSAHAENERIIKRTYYKSKGYYVNSVFPVMSEEEKAQKNVEITDELIRLMNRSAGLAEER